MPTPSSNLISMRVGPVDPTLDPEVGIVEPRHLRPEPADPSAGIDAHLELVPLDGPTEASNEPEPLEDEDENLGLDDPRWLAPGPVEPTPSEP